MKHRILYGKCISEPFYDGQKLTKALIRYNTEIKGSSIVPDTYKVEGRTVLDVYCVRSMDDLQRCNQSDTILLVLDLRDKNAYTAPENPQPSAEEKKAYKGNDRLWFVGRSRDFLFLDIIQVKEIRNADDEVIASGLQVKTSMEENIASDRFEQFFYGKYEYNLFIPSDYDPYRKYPLVLFIGDATSKGDDHRVSLELGLGPVCWLDEQIQKSDPCFVLVPIFPQTGKNANSSYVSFPMTDIYYKMCKEVEKTYSIDPDRIYTTGQSMGCMNSYELMFRYPGYYAAALCVSGHWDRYKIASCAKRKQLIWSIASAKDGGAFPCYLETKELLDEKNIAYQWDEVDGSKPIGELDEIFSRLGDQPASFRFTLYEKDSSLRKGQEDECFSAHYSGWWLTYRIKAVLLWLLKQRRKEVSYELY